MPAKTTSDKKRSSTSKSSKRVRISDAAPQISSKSKMMVGPSSEAVPELPAGRRSALKKMKGPAEAPKASQPKAPFSEDIEMLQRISSESDGGEDSSDEEIVDSGMQLVDVSSLPKVITDGQGVQNKLAKAKASQTKNTPGVVYVGRLPKGFEEKQLKAYFEQFGTVNRLRLSRNKKTGNSKHYAFLEFAHESVAKIVVDTMDNYLLLGHILVCKLVPQDNVHPTMWQGAGKKFKVMPKNIRERRAHNAVKSATQQNRISKRLLSRQQEKKRKIAESGIDYDFGGYRPTSKQAAITAE